MALQSKSRRSFIGKYLQGVAFFLSGGIILSSCGEKKEQKSQESAASDNPCDINKVSAEELQKREQLGYVKASPIPDNQCNNCNLYLPPSTNKNCAGCMLFKGPVNAEGYCTYWAPKV